MKFCVHSFIVTDAEQPYNHFETDSINNKSDPGVDSSTSVDACTQFDSNDQPSSNVHSHDREIQCAPDSVDSGTQCNGVLTVDVATQCVKVLSHTTV